MATPYETVYEAFLAKVQEDDWAWVDDSTQMDEDLLSILNGAIIHFKFPRIVLTLDATGFVNTLTNQEIQILANYMKVEWLDRTILSWENVKPYYAEADFSQANLLDKFIKLQETTLKKANNLQHGYYRSVNGRPYDFTQLAGS